MANAQRDQNNTPTILGVSSADGITPIPVYVDPITGAILAESTGWGSASDEPYDATSWNGVTSIAPSKNAVRDKIESMETEIGWKQDTLISGTNIKTVNGSSLLGSWDLEITSWGGGWLAPVYLTNLTSTTNPSYKQTSYTPDVTETIVSTVVNNNEVLAQTYIYDADIGFTQINAGTWSFNLHAYVSSAVGVTKFRIETFKRTSGGTETTLFSVDSSEINATSQTLYQFQTTQGVFSCNTTDRLGTRVYVNTTAVINITASMVVWDGNATFFTTPLQIRASQVRNTPSGGISSTDVQGAINELDSEKVPTSRSLTINGTAYDLSADRSWTVTWGYEEIVFQDYAGTGVIGIIGTWDCMNARTLSKIVLYADTLPVGSNVIAELRKNSTTSGNILNSTLQLTTSDTSSNGRYVGTAVTSFTSASVSANDVLYLVLTSVGSTTPAMNIRACLYYT